MARLSIGLTAGRRYDNYRKWLSQIPEVEVVKISYEDNNFQELYRCRGLVLSGGEDVHPSRYGKPDYLSQYGLTDLDEQRDAFEWKALAYADQHEFSILGICRGLQVVNAYFGGTLVPDVVSFGNPDHTRIGEGADRVHEVTVVPDTLLRSITAPTGMVNSAHHQAADQIGEGLIVNARCGNVIEGLERADQDSPFLLCVQWHPERMTDQQSVFSRNILNRFIDSCR
jgi:putative glutamine amidotransferase